MLSQLYIKNIAVISEASIDFGPRFNVFTGETGAGKTILVSAINGVLGARMSRDIIRSGEDSAYVSALFTQLPQDVCAKIEEMGFEMQDDTLLIAREVGSRNLCKVNGRPATVQLLREIASMLIDVHGQKDNHRLLSPENHIAYIDAFGGLEDCRREYQVLYEKILEVRNQLERVNRHDREKEHQIDLLTYQIGEIESAALHPGEEEELLLKRDQIANAERIIRLLSQSKQLLDGEEEVSGILQMFEELTNNLSQLTHFLPQMEPLAMRMEEIGYDLSDCAGDLGNYLDQMGGGAPGPDLPAQAQIWQLGRGNFRVPGKEPRTVAAAKPVRREGTGAAGRISASKAAGAAGGGHADQPPAQGGQGIFIAGKKRAGISQHAFGAAKCQRRAQRLEAGWTGRAGIFNQLQCRRRAEAVGKNCLGRRAFPRDALD